MNEMIERVARAICEAKGKRPEEIRTNNSR
jgi:hypothetical protein